MRIYHLASSSEWQRAKERGIYHPASLDQEGLIHCSTAAQAQWVADSWMRGQRDLVLLCIDPAKLQSPLKWEPPVPPGGTSPPPSRDSDVRVPHLYGPLEVDAVVEVHSVPVAPDGRLILPAEALRAE